ncbi:unnamed protein product [Arctogadus glacialis]
MGLDAAVSWRWCSETISTPTKGSSELDWSSVDLPHSSPQTQIWTNMILVMWMFGAVMCGDGADSVPLTQDLDLSCDWRPQTQFWIILDLRWKWNTALLLTTKVEQ